MFNVTIYWRDEKTPVRKESITLEESMTTLTIFESDSEYTRIPLASVWYYDVEVV